MCMYSERMQILLSSDQRRRIDDEAARTGVSAAAIVRAALDARLGRVDPGQRGRALDELCAMRSEVVGAAELQELIDGRFDHAVGGARSAPS